MVRTKLLSSTFAVGAACGLLLSGCGSSAHSAASPTTTITVAPTTPQSAAAARAALAGIGPAAAAGTTVSLAKSPQGIFLIGPNGHSLYVFDEDKGTTSACTGGCAPEWPALTASGAISTGTAIDASQVRTATGQTAHQVTYYGHLLYYFSGDNAPGQTHGVGIPGWHLLGPLRECDAPSSLSRHSAHPYRD